MTIWHKKIPLGSSPEILGGAAQALRIEIVESGENFLLAKMPVDDGTKQPYGILNGGASCLLAETVGSVASNAALEGAKVAVGMTLNASHIKPVKTGYVYGKATPTHLGRNSHVWQITITDDSQKLICLVVFTLAIITPKESRIV